MYREAALYVLDLMRHQGGKDAEGATQRSKCKDPSTLPLICAVFPAMANTSHIGQDSLAHLQGRAMLMAFNRRSKDRTQRSGRSLMSETKDVSLTLTLFCLGGAADACELILHAL